MHTSITLLAAVAVLTLGAGPAPSADVDALIESYERAETDWKARLKSADSAGRRELRKSPTPAADYWERFDAAADAGEGRALFWMATHLRDKGLKSSELKERKPVLYGRILEQHAGAEWLGDVLARLPREKRYLAASQVTAFYEAVIAQNEHAEVRAQAMYRLGAQLLAAGQAEQGVEWLKKAGELADTEYGMMARAELSKPMVGELAPDFKGATIDGYEFKLSDYRGKVVLLDFYGFW